MSLLNKFTETMYKSYSKDGGKLLVHMGAASWIFGAVAQIGSVIGDKKIDKRQKKFLLPQEAADAAVNVGLFYSVCELIKRGGDYLVEKGSFLTDDIAKALTKINPANNPALNMKDWKKVFTAAELKGNLTKLLENAKNLTVIKNAPASEQATLLKAAEAALEKIEAHKNNVGIVTSIAASILACNILTPIARNWLASKMQKKLQYREDVETRKTQIRENITMKNPLPTSFKSFNNYNSFAGIKIN